MKIFIIFCSFLMALCVDAQTLPNVYQKMYDRTADVVRDTYLSSNANDYDSYGDGISYYLESCLIMYEYSKDKKYLDNFIYASNQVIKNRDDNRNVNQSKPYWSTYGRTNGCYGPITYHTGLILQSFAHYIYLSRIAFSTDFSGQLPSAFQTFDNESITTYSEFAEWVYPQLMDTWNYYYQYYWINNRGYRQYADDPCGQSTSSDVDGMDRNCNWGCVNAYMAMSFQGTIEGSLFLDAAITAAYQLTRCMHEYSNSTTNNFPYYNWSWKGWVTSNQVTSNKYSDNPPDDISHAGAVIDFVELCNKFKLLIKSPSNGCCPNGYFNDIDLKKFANTFIFKVYEQPFKYHNAINGTNAFGDAGGIWVNLDGYLQYGISRWLRLSSAPNNNGYNTQNRIFHQISDFYTSFLEEPKFVFSQSQTIHGILSRGGSIGASLLGIALAAKNQRVFKYLGRNSSYGGSNDDDWQGVGSGDLDGDGIKNDFVSIRNSDGGIYFHKILTNNSSYTLSSKLIDYSTVGYRIESKGSIITGGIATGVSNSYWKGITVGHFVQDIPGDQIAAIRESDGTIFVWKPVYNAQTGTYSLQTILTNSSSGTGNGWVSICSGDFDGDGVAEIAAVRNVDGGFFIWKVKKVNTSYVLNSMLFNNSSGINNQWSAICAGDLNNDGKAELCAVRNSDGGIWIWKIVTNNGVSTLSSIVSNNSSGANNLWNGMSIGDFNKDGVKDLILHRDFDGAFFIYNLTGTALTNKAIEYFPVNQNLRVFTKGNLPGNTTDILINLRNADGDILLYELGF